MLIAGTTGGDVKHGTFTMTEQVIFTLLIIVGSLMWSELIGTFAAVFSNLHPERTLYQNRFAVLFCPS